MKQLKILRGFGPKTARPGDYVILSVGRYSKRVMKTKRGILMYVHRNKRTQGDPESTGTLVTLLVDEMATSFYLGKSDILVRVRRGFFNSVAKQIGTPCQHP